MSVQQQERAMRTVLEGIVRQDDETLIRSVYRKCQALKDNRPSGLEDDELDAWVDAADKDEEAIARYQAEDLGDVDLKLAVLIDRIRLFMEDNKAGAFDLILAMSARDDLRRLTEQSAEMPRARSREAAEKTSGIEKGPAATEQKDEFRPPWPTCDRSSGRCQLSLQISDLETDLADLRRGIGTLFNLLEGCSMIDSPVEFELESAYFFAFTFSNHLHNLKAKWEELCVAAADKSIPVAGRAQS
jgi:hypothetical protein